MSKMNPFEEKKNLTEQAVAVDSPEIKVSCSPGKQVSLLWTLKNKSNSKWGSRNIYFESF